MRSPLVPSHCAAWHLFVPAVRLGLLNTRDKCRGTVISKQYSFYSISDKPGNVTGGICYHRDSRCKTLHKFRGKPCLRIPFQGTK